MRNSFSSFEVEVEADNCLCLISDPKLRVLAYQILSKDDKIFLASRLLLFRQDSFMLSLSTKMNLLPKQ